MANTIGEKELKTNWPVEKGLTAGTQRQAGRVTNLVIQEATLVHPDEKELL